MGLFVEITGEVAILIENGVYKQTPLYTRNGYIYAKNGSGFIRLFADGSTTKAKCRLDTLTFDAQLGKDQLGRLCDLAVVAGSKPLPQPETQKLLGLESR